MMMPQELARVLEAKAAGKWSGTIAMNLKDGSIVAFEVTDKIRIARETHVSPMPNQNGRENSDGQ